MRPLQLESLRNYVEQNIGAFHQKRIDKLDTLRLKDVLKRKNPYLFRAKNILIAKDLVQAIVDAYVSSSEEGIFGDWLEGLAIFVNQEVYDGRKSAVPGVDLEFDNDGVRYIVSIKSGPAWGNSSQIKKMVDNFNSARKVLRTSGAQVNVVAVNGCCYGRSHKESEYQSIGDYYKYCGQAFWAFISGDEDMYREIIEPLGYKAQEKTENFNTSYAQMINKFTMEFSKDFCAENGAIDWDKLLEFNSKRR